MTPVDELRQQRGQRRLITVTGPDRPGLVAAVSRVLAEEEVDIEDISMTRLSANFATMLLARGGDEQRLAARLSDVADQSGLHIHVEPAVEHGTEPEPDCYISAIGPNRTGIVAAISSALAAEQTNILEMTTRLLERTQVPVYLVRIEAASGPGGLDALRGILEEVARALAIEIRIEPIDNTDF